MSRNDFELVMKHLRFDIKQTRSERLANDRFALMREMLDDFAENCKTVYTPNFSLTIDEQLLPLRGRCPFITFMPNKPDKFGIKFWLMVEVESKYVCNIIPYLGATERQQRGVTPLGEDVVLRLIKPYKNKGYNVTTDNFFTSGTFVINFVLLSIYLFFSVHGQKID